jgi:hypothetical protein
VCLPPQAIHHADIKITMVTGHLTQKKKKKKSMQDPFSMEKKLGVVAQAYHLCYVRRHKIGESQFRLAWAKSETLSLK